jgi:hypothetical protein
MGNVRASDIQPATFLEDGLTLTAFLEFLDTLPKISKER